MRYEAAAEPLSCLVPAFTDFRQRGGCSCSLDDRLKGYTPTKRIHITILLLAAGALSSFSIASRPLPLGALRDAGDSTHAHVFAISLSYWILFFFARRRGWVSTNGRMGPFGLCRA